MTEPFDPTTPVEPVPSAPAPVAAAAPAPGVPRGLVAALVGAVLLVGAGMFVLGRVSVSRATMSMAVCRTVGPTASAAPAGPAVPVGPGAPGRFGVFPGGVKVPAGPKRGVKQVCARGVVPGVGGFGGNGFVGPAASGSTLTGTVVSVNGNQLVISTPGGNVTVTLAPATRITNSSPGSVADLSSGTRVSIGAAPAGNGRTARSIVILPAAPASGATTTTTTPTTTSTTVAS